MSHDPSVQRRGIRLFKSNPCNREVVEVEINCTRVAKKDPTIALRRISSCLSQRIWSGFGEGDTTSGVVIIAGGHGFEPSTKSSKSYPNRRDMNWSHHAK